MSKCKNLNCWHNKRGTCKYMTDIGQKPNDKNCPEFSFAFESAIMNRPTTTSAIASIFASILVTLVSIAVLSWLGLR